MAELGSGDFTSGKFCDLRSELISPEESKNFTAYFQNKG